MEIKKINVSEEQLQAAKQKLNEAKEVKESGSLFTKALSLLKKDEKALELFDVGGENGEIKDDKELTGIEMKTFQTAINSILEASMENPGFEAVKSAGKTFGSGAIESTLNVGAGFFNSAGALANAAIHPVDTLTGIFNELCEALRTGDKERFVKAIPVAGTYVDYGNAWIKYFVAYQNKDAKAMDAAAEKIAKTAGAMGFDAAFFKALSEISNLETVKNINNSMRKVNIDVNKLKNLEDGQTLKIGNRTMKGGVVGENELYHIYQYLEESRGQGIKITPKFVRETIYNLEPGASGYVAAFWMDQLKHMSPVYEGLLKESSSFLSGISDFCIDANYALGDFGEAVYNAFSKPKQ